MAQYTVTGTCGHTSHIELFGKHTARQSRIAWMETKPCTACWLREQGKLGAALAAARRAGENELADAILKQAKGETAEPSPVSSGPVSVTNAELADLGLV